MNALRLAVCSAVLTILSGAALAQETPSTGGQAVGGLFDALGLRKPPPPAPDFVTNSRREGLEYAPLVPSPEKSRKKSAAEMQAIGAELDRAIAENKRRAVRVKIPN